MSSTFSITRAVSDIGEKTAADAGRIFHPVGDEIGIGTGLIYNGVSFPIYVQEHSGYKLAQGNVLVLTHECDLDQSNDKLFNKDVLITPLIDFEILFNEIAEKRTPAQIRSYLGDLAQGRISQLMYLPPWEGWNSGAVLFLNRITHTRYEKFIDADVARVVALTGYGYEKLCLRIQQHLTRAKADKLPLSNIPPRTSLRARDLFSRFFWTTSKT